MTESETNFVYVSDLLVRRFPSIHEGLERILAEHGIGFGVVQGTKDIWIRDYAPIQVSRDGSFVLFRYFPDYLRQGYRHLITDAREFIPDIPVIRSCQSSDIILDGGNVVRHGDKAIMTDKVYLENRGMGRARLSQELRRLLKVDRLIVIPTEPGDLVGHADGVVRFVGDTTLLINDYRTIDPGYRTALLKVLSGKGLTVVEVPYRPWTAPSRGIPSAYGNYVNFLRVRGLVILPAYGIAEDGLAHLIIQEALSGSSVAVLDCDRISREGGVLNCVSSNVRL